MIILFRPKHNYETDSVMEIYEPFLSDAFVSLNSDSAQSTPIKILRDTGASQSLILADTLPFSEKTFSGTSVLIQGVECGFVIVPLHNIYLSSDLSCVHMTKICVYTNFAYMQILHTCAKVCFTLRSHGF